MDVVPSNMVRIPARFKKTPEPIGNTEPRTCRPLFSAKVLPDNTISNLKYQDKQRLILLLEKLAKCEVENNGFKELLVEIEESKKKTHQDFVALRNEYDKLHKEYSGKKRSSFHS